MSLEPKRGLARAALIGTLLFVALGAEANPTAPVVSQGPHALPWGGVVANGQATLNQQGTVLTVNNSPGAIINWRSFSIGSGSTTNFVQQSASSTVLNRVVGQNISTIAGKLLSNGHVFLTNPNGVLISSGAQINAASFTATTSGISDADFLAGNTQWSGEGSFLSVQGGLGIEGGFVAIGDAIIRSTGNITVTGGGNLSLLTAGTSEVLGGFVLDGGKLTLDPNNITITVASPVSDLPVGTLAFSGNPSTLSLNSALNLSFGGNVTLLGGSTSTGRNLTVAGGIIHWSNFSIGADSAGAFTQTTGSAVLNRAARPGLPAIYGVLQSNAPVSLLNAQGQLVVGGTIPVGGFVGGQIITTKGMTPKGTVTLTSQQGSPSIAASTPISTPVPTARLQTSIQPASAGTVALTAGRNVIATAANVTAIPQPAPAAAPAPAALATAGRSSAVGATISLQKREPMF